MSLIFPPQNSDFQIITVHFPNKQIRICLFFHRCKVTKKFQKSNYNLQVENRKILSNKTIAHLFFRHKILIFK